MRRFAFLLATLLLPAALPAQVMPTTVVRRGAGAGAADGEPVSFILEHAQDLELADSQRTALMNLRRRLRASNAPFQRQLDSLREMLSISMEPRRGGPTEEDRKKLARFEELARPFTDSMRVNNEAATGQARQLLDSLQLTRLDSISSRGRAGAGRRGQRPPDP